ncbi:MAG: hypothetical protein HKP40_07635 [Litoreibacter sp.]|nr:hypothetical protein [Litoreibacter sp.]
MPHTFETHLDAARDALLRARACVREEIRDYPSPIAGCDAQFNHLLAQRQRILEALGFLEASVFVPTPRSPTEDCGVESR